MNDIPENRPKPRRNPDGTFVPGESGNPGGRPRSTLKDYLKRKFSGMTDEEKEAFLRRVPPELQFRMAEGNPHQGVEHSGGIIQTQYVIRRDSEPLPPASGAEESAGE